MPGTTFNECLRMQVHKLHEHRMMQAILSYPPYYVAVIHIIESTQSPNTTSCTTSFFLYKNTNLLSYKTFRSENVSVYSDLVNRYYRDQANVTPGHASRHNYTLHRQDYNTTVLTENIITALPSVIHDR